jgi:hypothetical protein
VRKCDDDLEGVILDPEPGDEEPREVRSAKRKRGRVGMNFERIWWRQLADRDWDDVFPPTTRLYLLIRRVTQEGRKQNVALTSKGLAEIGMTRNQQWRYLIKLEARRRVAVARDGHRAVRVSLIETGDSP